MRTGRRRRRFRGDELEVLRRLVRGDEPFPRLLVPVDGRLRPDSFYEGEGRRVFSLEDAARWIRIMRDGRRRKDARYRARVKLRRGRL